MRQGHWKQTGKDRFPGVNTGDSGWGGGKNTPGLEKERMGGTWVAQWLSICLLLRSWYQGPGIESHIRLPTGSLLLPLPMSLPLSVCLL